MNNKTKKIMSGMNVKAEALIGDKTDANTREGDLLSLITLNQVLSDAELKDKQAMKAMANEETRYLRAAMRILTDQGDPGAIRMQEEFGRDMRAAVQLGKILKRVSDKKEVELLMTPFVRAVLNDKPGVRSGRSGFTRQNVRISQFDSTGSRAGVGGRGAENNPYLI